MKRLFQRLALLAAALLQPLAVTPGFTAETRPLKAGAARVDITPALADLPKPFASVRDKLFVRAVVLDDGATRAAIVVIDGSTMSTQVAQDLTARVAQVAGAPVAQVLLAVTHTHNAVRLDHNPVGLIIPGSPKITDATADGVIAAVRQAVANLQPARAGYATGLTSMVSNRGLGDHGSAAIEESDKTLGVLKVETLAGEPIAIIANAPVEPVLGFAMKSEISGDAAGVAERYVEQRYGDKPVVLYTVGAPSSAVVGGRRGGNLPPADTHAVVDAVGTILGEEILNASARVAPKETLTISGALLAVRCPGKVTTPLNNANSCSDAPGATLPRCVFTDKDTDPVTLNTGVLSIGDLHLVQADANITAPVWQKLKRAAPANTVLVSLYYGPIHYVVDDTDYPSNSYPVTASTAKRGCMAQGFIDGALAMMPKAGS